MNRAATAGCNSRPNTPSLISSLQLSCRSSKRLGNQIKLNKRVSLRLARRQLRRILRSAWSLPGPGVITGAADDDPSGIATYSVTGARTGYSLLWTGLLSLSLNAAVQNMCARIGLTTGKGLAAVLREHYSRRLLLILVSLLLIANTINIGADGSTANEEFGRSRRS